MKRNIHQPSFKKAEAQIATYLTLLRNNYSCKKIYGMLLDLDNYIVYSYDQAFLNRTINLVGLIGRSKDDLSSARGGGEGVPAFFSVGHFRGYPRQNF